MLIAFLLMSCSGQGTQDGLEPDKDGYVLVWKDDFNSSTLDRTKWEYQLGTGTEYGLVGWGNNESQYYTNRPENDEFSFTS